MPERSDDAAEVEAQTTRVLGFPVQVTDTVTSGRNSRVYRAEGRGGQALAVKRFYRTRAGTRDYLEAEYEGLSFLWNHGEHRVPRPIAVDADMGLLICEYVDGKPVRDSELADADIDEAVDFLVALKDLASRPGSDSLPDASEACFRAQTIVDNIGDRRGRLDREGDFDVLDGALHAFLTDEFDPIMRDTTCWSRVCLAGRFQEELSPDLRTLSPSDFGFHNCLRSTDGSLVFVDFEHFGWDDPAKTIADMLLHPAMELSRQQGERFVEGMLDGFAADLGLVSRVQALEPLYGLKWCMILLNEFVAGDRARRSFAHGGELDREMLLQTQLNKARNMLCHVQAAGSRLPHRN